MSGTIPRLTPAQIRTAIGDYSVDKGESYWRSGAIIDARQDGMRLSARCRGTRSDPYRVWATFSPNGLTGAGCSCPAAGDWGICKHVGALLLTWSDAPDTFVSGSDVREQLAARTHDELIGIIERMVNLYPDLLAFVSLELPSSGQVLTDDDVAKYRRVVTEALDSGENEWGSESQVVLKLEPVLGSAEAYAAHGQHESAATLYEVMLEEALGRRSWFEDQNGHLARMLEQCADGVIAALRSDRDGISSGRREQLLLLLLDADISEDRGFDTFVDAWEYLTTETTPDERQILIRAVRERMPAESSWSGNYQRERLGSRLLDLEADQIDDDVYLQICRETGRTYDLIDRLLALGRVDEAEIAAESLDEWRLLQIADLFQRYGHDELIERTIAGRAVKTNHVRLLDWLKQRHIVGGDLSAALEIAEHVFAQRPSLPAYHDVRDLATQTGNWAEIRPQLHERLRTASIGGRHVLIQVFLEEGDIDAALELLHGASSDTHRGGIHAHSIDLEVARAAESSRPLDAIDIYHRHVTALIAERQRGAYRNACALLVRIRDLHTRADSVDIWADYLERLRSETRQLRALRDEMRVAGLLDD